MPVDGTRFTAAVDALVKGVGKPEEVAREIALRLLTVRARTRHELLSELARRSIDEDIAARLVDRFAEVGLIDDAQFADDWVRSRQGRRQLSRRALSYELTRKGVDPEVIAAAVEVIAEEDEYQAALALATRKVRSTVGLDQQVRRRRLSGVLARRGFNAAITSRVLSEVLQHEVGGA